MGAFIDNEVVGAPGHVPPYSHTAVFAACDRTDLIACSDLRPAVMAEVGVQYNIPKEKQYTNYKELIDKEQPDIVSVATQPEHRAEIVIYAVEHGAKAIYAEKAMAASMAEADAMVEICEQNGVFFNLGTQRRWHPGFTKMKEIIDSGKLGAPKTIIFNGSTLFNGASHYYDNLLFLNSDRRAVWVQAHLTEGNWQVEGDRLTEDPIGHGIIQFENDVTAYAITPSREIEWEVNCEKGSSNRLAQRRVSNTNRRDHRVTEISRRLWTQRFPITSPPAQTCGSWKTSSIRLTPVSHHAVGCGLHTPARN